MNGIMSTLCLKEELTQANQQLLDTNQNDAPLVIHLDGEPDYLLLEGIQLEACNEEGQLRVRLNAIRPTWSKPRDKFVWLVFTTSLHSGGVAGGMRTDTRVKGVYSTPELAMEAEREHLKYNPKDIVGIQQERVKEDMY